MTYDFQAVKAKALQDIAKRAYREQQLRRKRIALLSLALAIAVALILVSVLITPKRA